MIKLFNDTLLNNSKYRVLEKANGDCYIKQKSTGKYFFKKVFFASRKYQFDNVTHLSWGYKDTVFSILVLISFCFIWLLIDKTNFIQLRNEEISPVLALTFILVNVVLHEIGHAATLFIFGGTPGRIRFKFYYFLPVISIDTSDAYLMPRHRGAFVCYAGVMMNIYICSLVIVVWPRYEYILTPIYTLIIFNLIPFSGVKTDGYNLFVRQILKVNDIKGKKSTLSKLLEIFLNITLIVIVLHYFYSLFF